MAERGAPPGRILTDHQLRQLDALGYLHLPGMFAPSEVVQLSRIHNRLIGKIEQHRALAVGESAGAGPLLLVPDFLPFFDDDRICGVADEIIGTDSVVAPTLVRAVVQGRANGWHADGQLPVLPGLKISIFLDEVGPDGGCLTVLPGSHQAQGSAAYRQAFLSGALPSDQRSVPGAVSLPSRPGDLQVLWRPLWHSTWFPPPRCRQIQVSFYGRPPYPAYDDAMWHYLLKLPGCQDLLWTSGYRLFSEHFIGTAGERRLRKVQPYLDAGFGDPRRPAPTEEQLVLSRDTV